MLDFYTKKTIYYTDIRGSVTEVTEGKSDIFFETENESDLYTKYTEYDLQISSSTL